MSTVPRSVAKTFMSSASTNGAGGFEFVMGAAPGLAGVGAASVSQDAAPTPWLPPHQKPTARGVYPTCLLGCWPGFSYWSGKRWGIEADSIKDAIAGYSVRWADQNKPWRDEIVIVSA